MNITILNGQSAHEGSTYQITRQIVNLIDADASVSEFSFPADYEGSFCRGCATCFFLGENECSDAEYVKPIIDAIVAADVVVLASPTYAYGISGALKTFLDHMGYCWMEHRPYPEMFSKVGLCIATSGLVPGSKRAVDQMIDNMHGWGISNVVGYPKAVFSTNWDRIQPKIKEQIAAEIPQIAEQVKALIGKGGVNEVVKNSFMATRAIQEGNVWNKLDRGYWEQAGWLSGAFPWNE